MSSITKIPLLYRSKIFWLLLVCLTLFYWILNYNFQASGMSSVEQSWMRYQALLLTQRPTPIFQHFDFSIPPLNLLVYLIAGNTGRSFVFALIAAFLVSFLILYAFTNFQTRLLKISFSATFIFSPSLLFSFLYTPDYVLFLIVYCLAFYFLLEFTVSEQVFYLFVFGILFGILGLIHFEVIWVSIFVFLFLLFRYYRKKVFLYYSIAALFPILFLIACWFFMAFIFQGDVLALFEKTFIAPLNFMTMFWYVENLFLFHLIWPFFLLYGITIYRMGTFRSFYTSSLFFIFLIPFFTPILLGRAAQEMQPVTFSSIFLIHFFLLFPFTGYLINEIRQKYFLTLFLIGFFILNMVSFSLSPEPHEKFFFRFITQQSREYPGKKNEEIAQLIAGCTLLADGNASFEILQNLNTLREVYLPPQVEFSTVLFTPVVFVEKILMRKSNDRVYDYYKKALQTPAGVEGFQKAYEDEETLVLERITNP